MPLTRALTAIDLRKTSFKPDFTGTITETFGTVGFIMDADKQPPSLE